MNKHLSSELVRTESDSPLESPFYVGELSTVPVLSSQQLWFIGSVTGHKIRKRGERNSDAWWVGRGDKVVSKRSGRVAVK